MKAETVLNAYYSANGLGVALGLVSSGEQPEIHCKPYQQAGHRTVPGQGMPKRQKEFAIREPSIQDARDYIGFPQERWTSDVLWNLGMSAALAAICNKTDQNDAVSAELPHF